MRLGSCKVACKIGRMAEKDGMAVLETTKSDQWDAGFTRLSPFLRTRKKGSPQNGSEMSREPGFLRHQVLKRLGRLGVIVGFLGYFWGVGRKS